MKRYRCYPITKMLLFGMLALISGCNQEDRHEDELQKGEAVTLEFDLSAAQTKAADNTELMASGNTIQVLAFNKSDDVTSTAPLASEVYTVGADGKAVGNLKLFRGEYDFYFMSYNTSGQPPLLNGSGGTITVDNTKDFMYSVLKGISVQPTDGKAELTVGLTSPFNRMGTQIATEVKANEKQPVSITSMKVNYITIKNLSTPLSWQLGEPAWKTAGQQFTAEQSFTEFIGDPDNNFMVGFKSTSKVFLPTDGSVPLEFIINMTVNGKDRNYKATLQKPFIQGMTYKFTFTLTFYGDIVLADLTLALKEYNTVGLGTDDMGKD